MIGNENYSFEILFITRARRKNRPNAPIRTPYLWANAVVIDDVNDRCPVIEG
jgi:hypothetical protein